MRANLLGKVCAYEYQRKFEIIVWDVVLKCVLKNCNAREIVLFVWLRSLCVWRVHMCFGFCVVCGMWELCESFPAVTRLTVYRRPQVSISNV